MQLAVNCKSQQVHTCTYNSKISKPSRLPLCTFNQTNLTFPHSHHALVLTGSQNRRNGFQQAAIEQTGQKPSTTVFAGATSKYLHSRWLLWSCSFFRKLPKFRRIGLTLARDWFLVVEIGSSQGISIGLLPVEQRKLEQGQLKDAEDTNAKAVSPAPATEENKKNGRFTSTSQITTNSRTQEDMCGEPIFW